MQKLSSLVLDRYDDVGGHLTNVEIRWFEKIAKRFTPEELSRLPDETFAVVLQDGDTVLRKFSMADAGNLGISLEYFMHNGHRLPVEAQKVAAANLLRGCEWYDFDPTYFEQLTKIALGLGTLIGGALVAPGAVREASNNLKAVQGAGPGIMTPEQIKMRRMQMGV